MNALQVLTQGETVRAMHSMNNYITIKPTIRIVENLVGENFATHAWHVIHENILHKLFALFIALCLYI